MLDIMGNEYEQLPMFINPTTIIDKTIDGRWDSIDHVTSEDAWNGKLQNSLRGGHTGSDFNNITKWQAFGPITLTVHHDNVIMGNGHHRVAMSANQGMQLIPCLWSHTSFAEDEYKSKERVLGSEESEYY